MGGRGVRGEGGGGVWLWLYAFGLEGGTVGGREGGRGEGGGGGAEVGEVEVGGEKLMCL